MNEELVFLLLFLALNFFQFLSFTILGAKNNSFFPRHMGKGNTSGYLKQVKLFYFRDSVDFLRLNFDVVLLFLFIAPFVSPLVLRTLTFGFSVFGFIYLLYISVVNNVFNLTPCISSDLQFAKVGKEIKLVNAKHLLLILPLLFAIFYLLSYLSKALVSAYKQIDNPLFIYSLLLLFCLMGLLNIRRFGYPQMAGRVVLSPVFHLFRNIAYSKKVQKATEGMSNDFKSDFSDKAQQTRLAKKPNIIFICIESYGSVLFKDERFAEKFGIGIQKQQKRLAQNGFHTCSITSDPPVFGGGSWLSYSSFFYGIRFDNHILFNHLLKNAPLKGKYNSLFAWLKLNGYDNYFLNGLGEYTNKIDWDNYNRLYDIDEFIEYYGINYKGQVLDFVGHIKSIPDQYTLNYGMQHIEKKKQDPFCLFFISLNSHHPFHSPLQPAKNWESLNDPKVGFETTQSVRDLSAKYLTSIEYQLESYMDMIANDDNPDNLYIVFGDHQPPVIANKLQGLSAPIHIIAKDEQLIKSFYKYGFANGLNIDPKEHTTLNHEGFYSLFLRELLKNYGSDPTVELEYLPLGEQLMQ